MTKNGSKKPEIASKSIPAPYEKKARTREQPPRKSKKQPLCPSMAMDDFLVAQNQMDPAESEYILPVEAKDWVMETLDQSWRGFKCRLKRDHYYMYDTYEERLKHPPKRVLEAHYKTLLAYWGTPIAKQAMRELEANQDDQSGKSVKDPFDEVMGNARRGTKLLQGLGATRKKRKDKGSGTSLILPEEVMEYIKSAITADVQKDINAEIEEFAKEKEVHAAQVAAQEAEIERKTKELESETLKLQEIRMDIEN
uniref:Transposase, Ptta/En/Spm, plant n=1 Tax=Chenopodium quinoa TaxID=63459 RepID=A0A803N798_CHEQI